MSHFDSSNHISPRRPGIMSLLMKAYSALSADSLLFLTVSFVIKLPSNIVYDLVLSMLSSESAVCFSVACHRRTASQAGWTWLKWASPWRDHKGIEKTNCFGDDCLFLSNDNIIIKFESGFILANWHVTIASSLPNRPFMSREGKWWCVCANSNRCLSGTWLFINYSLEDGVYSISLWC